MNAWQQSLLVFFGAGVGANARYWISIWISSKWQSFPWSTLTINISGSLLLGFLLGVLDKHSEAHVWRIFLGVGLLGGYTTFSTFSMEAVALARSGHHSHALLYIIASCVGGVAAAYVAYAIAKSL